MMAEKPNNTDSLNLSDKALEFLGLSQQPFSASILSDSSIFSDATLDQLLDTTRHHLQFSDLLLLIEGDIGSGKTTLFRQLLQNEIDNLFLISVPASATYTLTQIQQTISVHLKDQGDANHLEDNLKRLQVFDQTPVLVIDDAHVLADTTLQELLRYQKQLETENKVKLKILMLANKGMAKTIETISDLQHNQLYVQEIPAYTPSQIYAFLLKRLSAVNYQGENHLNNDVAQVIFKKSNGTPLQIMEQSVKQLEIMAKKHNRSSSGLMNPKILFAGLAAIILIGIAIFYFLPEDNSIKQSNAAAIENTLPPTVPETPEAPEANVIEAEATVIESSLTDNPKEINPVAENELNSTDNPVNENNASLESNTLPVEETQNQTIEEPVTAESEALNPKENTALPIIKPESIEPSKNIITPEKETIKIEPVVEKIIEKKPEPLDKYLTQLSALGLHDPIWIMQQPNSHWTLQIMGARFPFSLYKFAKQHELNQSSAWFKTDLGGKPWYILMHGQYTNKETARQAVQNLPSSLKKSKPWIKNIGAIKKSIQP
jgi:DamX protein